MFAGFLFTVHFVNSLIHLIADFMFTSNKLSISSSTTSKISALFHDILVSAREKREAHERRRGNDGNDSAEERKETV